MIKTIKPLVLLLIIIVTAGCSRDSVEEINSPLATVIKLESAISMGDSDIALEYIDIMEVYGDLAEEQNTEVEKIWNELISFNVTLNNEKKFTSTFPFHKYTFSQEFDGQDYANVRFISLKESGIKNQSYKLNKSSTGWRVVSISYE